MNKMTKLAAAIALASGALSAPTMAVELSANAGFVTDYYFRGVNLGDAGAYGGLDADLGAGFYAGTWIISDNGGEDGAFGDASDPDTNDDGLETDFYVGWATEFENGLGLDIAYNRYEYTYTSDYEDEYVISAGFAGFGVSYFDGTAHGEETGGTDTDYDGYTFSWSGEVFGFLYGSVENDETDDKSGHDWIELSASGEIAGLDVTAVLGKTTNVELSDSTDGESGDGYFFLDVSKSFDL
ncbi:MAG: hypothetical protein AseanaTS_04060 [Candidatus Pelagadaptatus aseana]|uniref:TorF family putative porin n=1 Tax=Candidatus Pelagadaptatus aseana TaxID=3120508 RepID=UPI0039B3108D